MHVPGSVLVTMHLHATVIADQAVQTVWIQMPSLPLQSRLAGDIQRDFWLAYDLLQNPKDHAEFTIVRNWVQEALEVHAPNSVCAQLPPHCRRRCCPHALLLHEIPKDASDR